MSKRITHSELLKAVRYDPETGEFRWLTVRRTNGGLTSVGQIAGSSDARGYRKVCINGTHYYQHRLAIFYVTKRWPKQQVDHRNGNTSDNRYSNLRQASPVENGRNRKIGTNSSSGVIGVLFVKPTGLWRAHIKLENRRVNLGEFVLKSDAAAARAAAERKHFGEFRGSAR